MNIFLSEVANSWAYFGFPSLPEEIQVRSGMKYQSYDIINKGVVKFPKGTDIHTVSWDGTFYGEAKRYEVMNRFWKPPVECKKRIKEWMENGTVLRLMITDVSLNLDVTIESFDYKETGAFGNVSYSISLVRHTPLMIYTTAELSIAAYEKKVEARPEPAQQAGTPYTIVKGDTLWKISKNHYGKGSSWTTIYNANSAVIEAAAQNRGKSSSSNGHWIYPGTVITIP